MITVVINREDLPGGLDSITLDNDGPYILAQDGFMQPSRVPVTTVEANMFIDGGLPTGLRLDVSEFVLRVIVVGDTRAQLENRIENLIETVSEQLVYTMTTQINGGELRGWNAYAGPVGLDNSGTNASIGTACSAKHYETLIATIPVQPRSF